MMKIKKKPVQIVIPGGRIRSLDILCNHLNHEKQYFDECFIWINTDYSDEVDFIKSIGKKYDFVKYIEPKPEWKIDTHSPAEGIACFINEYCKYVKNNVRVIIIENITADLCGGCHTTNTSQLKLFLLKEIVRMSL